MKHAKQKKKPWYRIRNLILFFIGVIGTILCWMTYETVQVMNGVPNPTQKYWSAHLDRVRTHLNVEKDEAGEAFDQLLAAIDQYEQTLAAYRLELERRWEAGEEWYRFENDYEELDLSWLGSTEVPLEKLDREQEAIRRLQEAGVWDQLRLLTDSVAGVPEVAPDSMFIMDSLVPYTQLRGLSTARKGSMIIAQNQEDWLEIARAFDDLKSIIETSANCGTLIAYLVAVAIDTIALEELSYIMQESELSEEACEILLKSFEKHRLPPVSLAFEGERAMFYDIVQQTFTDDGNGEGYAIPSMVEQVLGGMALSGGASEFIDAFASRFLIAPRKETLRKYDEIMDAVIAASEKLPIDKWQEFDNEAMEAELEENKVRYAMVHMILGASGRVVDAATIIDIHSEGVRTMVGIELYHALNGELPKYLDALVPEVFEELPVDPLHGGQFGYLILDQPDEYGREYLLYSTGFDQTDDGGKMLKYSEHNKGDRVAITVPEATGVDFVINRPRNWQFE